MNPCAYTAAGFDMRATPIDAASDAPANGTLDGASVRWSTVLRPHRSANHTPLMLIAVVLIGGTIIGSVALSAIGAWPVFVFLGFDLLLLYLAVRLNLRRARAFERLTLTDEELRIERVDPWGRHRQWSVPPHWLRVVVVGAEDGLTPCVELHTHGRVWTIATFLHPTEQETLAGDIRTAVAGLKTLPGDQRSFED